MTHRVLICDDDAAMCALVSEALGRDGLLALTAETGEAGMAIFDAEDIDAVVVDLNLGDTSGLDVCAHVRSMRPDVPVVIMTAFGDMDSAIAAIRAGAHDFINKPVQLHMLVHTIRRALEHRELGRQVARLTREVKAARGVGTMVGTSPVMQRLYDLIGRVAPSDVGVLISGESGTGKELVARAVHSEGEAPDAPFVAVNCAAVPEDLLESELFGHVRGAFTGAQSARKGLLLEAGRGTLLLDEVGEMPLDMQTKLLRALQERVVRPVGSNEEKPVHARILAATNRDLEAEVEAGRFREDLYYRLNVVELHVPPLRARGADILVLAQHFVESAAERNEKEVKGISPEAARKIRDYDWPGNVRQLENAMERAVALTRHDQILVEDLPARVQEFVPVAIDDDGVDPEQMLTLEEVERRYIERVMRACNGNKAQAARTLGLDRRTLYRKLERFEDVE